MTDHKTAYWKHRFQIRFAAQMILAGGVIAYPTEGVWGLGCDPTNPEAVQRILHLKQREPDKGLILVAANWEQLKPFVAPLSAIQIARITMPTPHAITWIAPVSQGWPWLTGGRSTIAIRVSHHPVVKALCELADQAIVSTSANPSGKPAARDSLRVKTYFRDTLDMITPGKIGRQHGPSQIQDIVSGVILRKATTKERDDETERR